MSVIVVNWNGRRYIADCLDSLRRQTYRNFEVIVVDNGSDDDSVSFIRRAYPEVTLLALPGNSGFAAANNRGLIQARGEFVALLNNDAAAAETWLEHLLHALRNHPQAGAAATKMLLKQHPQIIDRAGDGYSIAGAGQLRGRGARADKFRQSGWIFGACAGAALYRRCMFSDTGWFDEDFFLLYEDVDLSLRALLKGYGCIFVPEAVVYHQASLSIGRDSDISVYYGHRNLEWVYLQNLPAPILALTLLPHLLYNLAALLYFGRRGQSRIFLQAKRDALQGLRRAWRKRRSVQTSRRVTSGRIWKFMAAETFLGRLQQRRADADPPAF